MNTHRDNVLEYLNPYLNSLGDLKGKKVLEIGHGTDRQMREALEAKGLIYNGAESWIGVNNQGTQLMGDEYLNCPMEDLKQIMGEQYDIVFSCHAFEHCERPVDALREMQRVCRRGGKVITVTPWPCKHHIIDKDHDHINVLNSLQLFRLFAYTKYSSVENHEQKPLNWKEQDWNIFMIGTK